MAVCIQSQGTAQTLGWASTSQTYHKAHLQRLRRRGGQCTNVCWLPCIVFWANEAQIMLAREAGVGRVGGGQKEGRTGWGKTGRGWAHGRLAQGGG